MNINNLDTKYLDFNIKQFKSQGYIYFRIQKRVSPDYLINVTGKTKDDVREKYFAKLQEYLSTDYSNVNVNKMTFGEFVHYYLFDIVLPSNSIKQKTFTSYEVIYRVHILPYPISNVKLIDLRKEHFQKYFNNILKSDLKLSTIRQIKIFMSTVLNYAVSEDYIIKNYCTSVKLPKSDKVEAKNKLLTDEEISKILTTCKDKQLLLIIKLALSTGMRIGEILALIEEDFNFNDCSININKTITVSKKFKNNTEFQNTVGITSPKSQSSIRTVYFSQHLVKDIKSYILSEKERYLKIGKLFKSNTPIFTNRKFDTTYPNNFRCKIDKLFKSCNINATGFHILRHTAGSKLYQAGINIKTISEQLGHSDTSITSNIYVHLDDNDKKEAIKHLDKYFKTV